MRREATKTRMVAMTGHTPLVILHWREYAKRMSGALSESSFWILTVLAKGRQHGYAIMQQIALSSGGAVSPNVTTLYAALERLTRSGSIIVDGEEIVAGRARRYFTLSNQGSEELSAEVLRMKTRLKAVGEVGHPSQAPKSFKGGPVLA